MKNVKEIGKELLGRSLNNFHRKAGLGQIERNVEMQDKILDGILSITEDGYLEKTEENNMIHLENSGDGAVVVDSIEGNTMVNLWDINKVSVGNQASKNNNKISLTTTTNRYSNFFVADKSIFKPNTTYTFVINVTKNTLINNDLVYITSYASSTDHDVFVQTIKITPSQTGVIKVKTTTREDLSTAKYGIRSFFDNVALTEGKQVELDMIILEGDWTNREVPPYFTGIQSSFEDKVNDEGKYEIEILSNNKNIYIPVRKTTSTYGIQSITDGVYKTQPQQGYSTFGMCNHLSHINDDMFNGVTKLKKGVTYTYSCKIRKVSGTGALNYFAFFGFNKNEKKYMHSGLNSPSSVSLTNEWMELKYTKTSNIDADVAIPAFQVTSNAVDCVIEVKDIQLEIRDTKTDYEPQKSNKIKVLVNEPLSSVPNGVKDRLCIKDGKLVVERNCKEKFIDGTESWSNFQNPSGATISYAQLRISDLKGINNSNSLICDKFVTVKGNDYAYNREMLYAWQGNDSIYLHILTTKLSSNNMTGFKTYLKNNNFKFIYELKEPIYEEVTDEYGEPIILEGYENGTLYIDSAVIPTTTVRYTQKFEALTVLNEVKEDNVALTSDINDNIITYMMEVDMMILEKELSACSTMNLKQKRIGELDMTSMQKRTQEMLERLFKGKTLTKEECLTRITTYLNAGKITDEQAEELTLLVEEIYA